MKIRYNFKNKSLIVYARQNKPMRVFKDAEKINRILNYLNRE